MGHVAASMVEGSAPHRRQPYRSFRRDTLELVSDQQAGIVALIEARGRMLLRAATLDDERFTMSSLAILARSSTQILARYHEWYSTSNYNLAWHHVRQITTCAHVTLICYWRQELLKGETETNLASALWILGLAEPRWTTFAQSAREKLGLVATSLGQSPPVFTS